MVKGICYQVETRWHIIDLSHEVNPFAVSQAAYFLSQSYRTFPEGSLHICLVNLFYSKEPQLILAHQLGHWFLMPDNGILSLLFQPRPEDIYRVGFYKEGFREVLSVLHDILSKWHNHPKIMEWASKAEQIEDRLWLHPVVQENWIRGNVIYIDRFENVVVNVHQTLFERIGNGRGFRFHYRPHDMITRISEHYGEVREGDPLLLFNSAGFLEIAVRTGNAASLLNLKMDDSVLIDFSA